jgi:predicted methyltransferase
MSRSLQIWLARHPACYLRLLTWLRRGSLEKKLYLSLVRPGDIVFDIGANQGYFTLLFSDLVGPAGYVHAFEPVPPTFARLRARIEQGQRYRNVRLNSVACSQRKVR